MRRCDFIRLFTVLDVTVNLYNKSLRKLAQLKYFSILKIVTFFDIYLASDGLDIDAPTIIRLYCFYILLFYGFLKVFRFQKGDLIVFVTFLVPLETEDLNVFVLFLFFTIFSHKFCASNLPKTVQPISTIFFINNWKWSELFWLKKFRRHFRFLDIADFVNFNDQVCAQFIWKTIRVMNIKLSELAYFHSLKFCLLLSFYASSTIHALNVHTFLTASFFIYIDVMLRHKIQKWRKIIVLS